tara:strand:- start:361 stop:579 length:219 start_codon:yes stop_codon:yes gene_type:complete
MGFTIEKEYTARKGTQTAAQKERMRRARKRSSGRSAIRELKSNPRLKSIQNFMGKFNSTSKSPLTLDKDFNK